MRPRRTAAGAPDRRYAGPPEAGPPVLALTQGDPAGVGPEILLKVLAGEAPAARRGFDPLPIAERGAFEALREAVPGAPWGRLRYLDTADPAAVAEVRSAGGIPVIEPAVAGSAVARSAAARTVTPGRPTAADAAGALAALDRGVDLVGRGVADALVTAPVNKAQIARHALPGFRGHTDYLAAAADLERYGRDYLMAFLAPDLKVALLTVHLPLAAAVAAVRRQAILDALRCLHRHLPTLGGPGGRSTAPPQRIAVAGLNPHAGEGGLLGSEEQTEIAPAVAAARGEGIDARGPESPDSIFARARRGEVDWVLALYHDQGLIAVKTAAPRATNWTLGLPYLRTSVDHGTAYDIAGRGVADPGPLRAVIETTVELLASHRIPSDRIRPT